MRIYRFSSKLLRMPEDYDGKLDSIISKLSKLLQSANESGEIDVPRNEEFTEEFSSPYYSGKVRVHVRMTNLTYGDLYKNVESEYDSPNKTTTAMAILRPDLTRFNADGGYDAYILVFMKEALNGTRLFIKKNEGMLKLKEKNPRRYGHIDIGYMYDYWSRYLITHELVHALDPRIIEGVRESLHSTEDKDIDRLRKKNLRILSEPWGERFEEVEAEFGAGVSKFRGIVTRSIENGYSDEILSELREGLSRMRSGNFVFSDLTSVRAFDINLIRNLLQAGKVKKARIFIKKLADVLEYFIRLIESSKKVREGKSDLV